MFNVSLRDDISTAARPLRINYRDASFGYDYRRDVPTWQRQISGQYNVADYVTTNVEIQGKKAARAFMENRNWHRYYEPPSVPIQMPTPRPVVTATPVPTATPLPVNVASTSQPLEARIHEQLDIFLQEQSRLATDIRTSMTAGAMTELQATQVRLEWLEAQKRVLDLYYPRDSELVRDAKAQWEVESNRVRGMGKFRFED
ncbi:MAG: hypothetical protein ACR2IE_11570 [Candidatus Sumerlaeaceae bacterium]